MVLLLIPATSFSESTQRRSVATMTNTPEQRRTLMMSLLKQMSALSVAFGKPPRWTLHTDAMEFSLSSATEEEWQGERHRCWTHKSHVR